MYFSFARSRSTGNLIPKQHQEYLLVQNASSARQKSHKAKADELLALFHFDLQMTLTFQ